MIGLGEFSRQMQFLRDEGWRVVSTSGIVAWLLDGGTLPPKACAVHFDNGWLDTFSVALPALRDFGITATCFPITSGIEAAAAGSSKRVRTLTEGQVEHPFMNWGHLQALLDAGWEIGAHTHTHGKMADTHASLADAGVVQEVEESHRLFQKHLGQVPSHFAYPSGSRTTRTDELLASHYRSLRLWRWDWPIRWFFTDATTSRLGLECQNIDARVPWEDFRRICREAAEGDADA